MRKWQGRGASSRALGGGTFMNRPLMVSATLVKCESSIGAHTPTSGSYIMPSHLNLLRRNAKPE